MMILEFCVGLITPGLRKDIQCHVQHTLCLKITKSDITPQVKNGQSDWLLRMASSVFLRGSVDMYGSTSSLQWNQGFVMMTFQ